MPNAPGGPTSAGAQRPPPPEATPGLRRADGGRAGDRRRADIRGRPLDERFAADDGGPRSPASTRATARWRARSPTVAMRRLGTIRKALGASLEKGCRARPGRWNGCWSPRAAQIPVPGAARPCRRRSRRARGARRSRQRALRGAGQCGAAQRSRAPKPNLRRLRPARRRHAALARPALARQLRRGDRARHRRAPIATSRRSISPSRATPRLGGAARRRRAADRLGAARNPRADRRTGRLRRRRMVGAGRRRRVARAAARRRARDRASSISAPRRAAKARNSRAPARASRGRPLGGAAEARSPPISRG